MLQLYSINLCPREWVSALSFVLFLFGKWGAEELHYVHEMKLGVFFTLHDQKDCQISLLPVPVLAYAVRIF